MGNSQNTGKLNEAGGILIDRKPQMLEIICGIEAKNAYDVKMATKSSMNPGKVPDRIMKNDVLANMKMWEQSECCERISCGPCHSLVLNVNLGIDKDPSPEGIVYKFDKPFSCPRSCCMMTKVTLRDGQASPLDPGIATAGFTRSECCTCGMHLDGWHDRGNPVYKARANFCCNTTFCCNLCCPCCCGDMVFPVMNAHTGDLVANIVRPQLDCVKAISQQNTMYIDFKDENLTLEQKGMISAMMVAIEFEYYQPQNRNSNNGG